MESNEIRRVVFHSRNDMSVGYNLQNAERLLRTLDVSAVVELNDFLELYHIKLYFDNEIYLSHWDDQTKSKYRGQVESAYKQLQTLFRLYTNESILDVIDSVEYNYRESFWRLFSLLQVFRRITGETISLILQRTPRHIFDIITNQPIIKHFDKEIRDFLVAYEDSAELLLNNYEEGKRLNELDYHFPKSLTLADKERIIEGYIEQDEPNLNYIRLVEHSKDSEYLKISAKVRLKAKKKSEQLNNKIFETGNSWKEGISVTLVEDQQEPVIFSWKEHFLEASYSVAFLDERGKNSSLFSLFKSLFSYTDSQGLISLVNRDAEMDVIEKIHMQSKNEYKMGMVFRRKDWLSYLQLRAFEHYLKKRNKTIEEVIESYIKIVIVDQFGVEHLQFKFPSENATFLERIRIVAPEMEFLLKQYQCYTNEGEIDFELIELNSKPLVYSEIKSLLNTKYGYICNEKLNRLKFHFFSDQHVLSYVEPFKEKYRNLFNLLSNENVSLDSFESYQFEEIRHLIDEGYLCVDANGLVKIDKEILISITGDLHRNEGISYMHYTKDERRVLDEMAAEDLIRFEDTLFTKQEQSYFHFYLNKKEYTNGLDIRNKYLHGTNRSIEAVHEYEYYMLLRLIILMILKVTDDMILARGILDEYMAGKYGE